MIVDDTLNWLTYCLFDDLFASSSLTFFRSRSVYSRFGWNRRRTGHASRSHPERDRFYLGFPLAYSSVKVIAILSYSIRSPRRTYLVYMYLIRTGEGRARFSTSINEVIRSHVLSASNAFLSTSFLSTSSNRALAPAVSLSHSHSRILTRITVTRSRTVGEGATLASRRRGTARRRGDAVPRTVSRASIDARETGRPINFSLTSARNRGDRRSRSSCARASPAPRFARTDLFNRWRVGCTV